MATISQAIAPDAPMSCTCCQWWGRFKETNTPQYSIVKCPLCGENARRTMRRTRDTDVFNIDAFSSMLGCTNDRQIFGVPDGCLRMTSGSGCETRFENEKKFFRETYYFDIQPVGFEPEFRSAAGEKITGINLFKRADFSSLADTVEILPPDIDSPVLVGSASQSA